MKFSTRFLVAALIVLAVTAAYANHFHNGFHFDDFHTVVNNIYVRDIRNIPLFFIDGTSFSSLPANQTYRPVVSATLALDYAAATATGSGTLWFHLPTFLLFLAQGLLMFLFFRGILRRSGGGERSAEAAAFLAVAVYLLHPANAETINYVIARSDSLSTLFTLLAFVLFITSPLCRRRHLYLVPLAAGALAKPPALAFVPLLFLYLFLFEEQEGLTNLFRRGGARAVAKTVPSFLFSAALLVFIHRMQPQSWAPGGGRAYNYLITQPFVALRYFGSFLLPVGLSADTDLKPFRTILDPRALAGFAFVVLLVGAAVLLSRRERLRPVSFGLLWFLVTLLPTSLLPLAEVMNDHRTFLPYAGLTLAAAWSLTLCLERASERITAQRFFRGTVAALLGAILLAAGWGTHRRNAVWKDEESMWRDVTMKSPGNGRGHMNYGLALMAKGDYSGAEASFRKALTLVPRYSALHVNMGVLKGATGNDREAELWFRSAISCSPRSPDGYFFYGRFLKSRDRSVEAIRHLRQALGLSPAHLYARHLLMELYRDAGMTRELAVLAAETLRIAPGDGKTSTLLRSAAAPRVVAVKEDGAAGATLRNGSAVGQPVAAQ